MILLTALNIAKTYGEKVIFDDLSISIDSNEKIGLIGINGTGKSSLLKILAGKEVPDKGDISVSNELHMEYLPQNPTFNDDLTVIEQVFMGESEFMKVLLNYERTLLEISKDNDNPKLHDKLLKLSEKMDALNIWQIESEAKAILTQLGISNFEQKIGTLSGGQKKRIALAGVLIRPCNLLILDEPTNHLDNETIDYLEEILKNKKCALIMVTHDRYFLDRVTNRIVELDGGKLYRYEGNYTTFLEQKAQRESIDQRMKEKEKALFKQELEWMKKGVEARRTKQKARQDRFFALKENMSSNKDEKMEINLSTSRLGKKVIEFREVTKKFGEKVIVSDFSYVMVKEDRIGIIGKNGVGKSTLLNMIVSKLIPDSGTIELGETVKIGYYSQENKDMDENLRVIDYIKNQREYIKAQDGTLLSASKMLEKFLFPPHMQYAPISRLSGGEKRRLYLLGVLMNDINVLLLDEPTNDLDIQTLQILEEYIDDFDGPVIAVSHDRYFLDKISEKIFEFDGTGHIISYPGNYSDYALKKKEVILAQESMQASKEKTIKKTVKPSDNTDKVKFTYKEKLEYEHIDEEIEELENALKKIEEEILKNATDFIKLAELDKEKQLIEEKLLEKIDRWEYLNEKAAKIKV